MGLVSQRTNVMKGGRRKEGWLPDPLRVDAMSHRWRERRGPDGYMSERAMYGKVCKEGKFEGGIQFSSSILAFL